MFQVGRKGGKTVVLCGRNVGNEQNQTMLPTDRLEMCAMQLLSLGKEGIHQTPVITDNPKLGE